MGNCCGTAEAEREVEVSAFQVEVWMEGKVAGDAMEEVLMGKRTLNDIKREVIADFDASL